jgi:secreted protein with Ig-like and vWFA domain
VHTSVVDVGAAGDYSVLEVVFRRWSQAPHARTFRGRRAGRGGRREGGRELIKKLGQRRARGRGWIRGEVE